MKRLIIYDLDGTLVDTGEDIARAVNYMLREMHGAMRPAEEIRRFVGRGLHDLIARCLDTEHPAQIARGTQLFEAHYAAHLTDCSQLYPGVLEMLDALKSRAQAVVTNKPQPFARDLLAALGVAEYFVDIIAGGTTYPKKPDPAAVRALMHRHRVRPEDTVLIGDSLIDVETGKNAGVSTVMMTHGFTSPDELKSGHPEAVVDGFAEFLELARSRGW